MDDDEDNSSVEDEERRSTDDPKSLPVGAQPIGPLPPESALQLEKHASGDADERGKEAENRTQEVDGVTPVSAIESTTVPQSPRKVHGTGRKVQALWSKLRAIAYVASMQVRTIDGEVLAIEAEIPRNKDSIHPKAGARTGNGVAGLQ